MQTRARRGWWVLGLTLGLSATGLALVLACGHIAPPRGADNPLSLAAASAASGRAVRAIQPLVGVPFCVLFLAAAGCLVLRLRRSRDLERQQIKWVVYRRRYDAGRTLETFSAQLRDVRRGRRLQLVPVRHQPAHGARGGAAGRAAGRSGAIVTWAVPERCEAAVYLAALGSQMPAPPPGAPGPFALSAPGAWRRSRARRG